MFLVLNYRICTGTIVAARTCEDDARKHNVPRDGARRAEAQARLPKKESAAGGMCDHVAINGSTLHI